ncbi:response regulator [Paenibacillus soyae]|uniref:Response regulator n=1 Tax=Paenibacillus soyae TaxID=2969249 RepID=A0A9X2MVJ3_9BACL|nr:response regulator [Paenibacillus soyae]MCR2807089.1 response regulator [Paenibacillus soyae]
MYSVLIAEDSKPILRNIKMLLESSELPIRVAATASNGEEALALLRQQPVDILITDIRMPKMDGLALIEQSKEITPELKVVLVSSYSDFEYTRKAINLQVFDYLLKPVERKSLIEVMERMIGQLNETREDRLAAFRGIVDPGFLTDMRLGDDFFAHNTKLVLLIGRQPFTARFAAAETNALQHDLSRVCSPHPCWLFPLDKPERYLLLAEEGLRDKYSSASECMSAISAELQSLGLQACMAASLQPVELAELRSHYEKLEQGMADELRLASPLLLDIQYRFRQSREDDRVIPTFMEMIQQRHKEQFRLKLAELLRRWRSDNVHAARLEELLVAVSEAFANASESDNELSELAELEAEARELLELDSYELFCDSVLEWTDAQFDLLLARTRKSAEELFAQIENHMELHKYSQLSMTELAKKFHVSPSYISRIIKRYTNSTFVHHYMKMKIDEACRLIRSKPEMKVKELSDALSFSDQHYFSKVFKEYTGYSPTDFKEKVKAKPDGESGEV